MLPINVCCACILAAQGKGGYDVQAVQQKVQPAVSDVFLQKIAGIALVPYLDALGVQSYREYV